MIKFGKSEKNQNIRFSQFQNRNKEGAKREDLKILVHLKHGKGVRSIKSQDRRNSSPKLKLKKSNYLVWDIGVSDFFRRDKVRLGFEI
jgi:hypothetical protein